MYEQTEYLYAYGLIAAFLLLGMLVVCIPRPRKKGFIDPQQAEKEKRLKTKKKAQMRMEMMISIQHLQPWKQK